MPAKTKKPNVTAGKKRQKATSAPVRAKAKAKTTRKPRVAKKADSPPDWATATRYPQRSLMD